MSNLVTIYILFIYGGGGGVSADIIFEPCCTPSEVSIDTVEVEGITYHTVSVADFPLPMSGEYSAGLPSIPFTAQTFLLPPDIAIDTIVITSASWDTLPGRYYLYPAQSGSMEDTTFALPDTEVYASEDPFPSQPVAVTRQGSAMGYSVASLSGTPVRYIPADSLLMVLTSVSLDIRTSGSEFERIAPVRETEWSASIRERGILSLVANPSAIYFYQRPTILSHGERTSPLNILDSPSLEGDGVDMVIITSGPNGSGPDLTSAFQELADYRTAQGIITTIRTVDWIDNLYSGCDIQEKMRNFIRDAHEQWGIQAVLLGGDDWIVPVREFTGGYYPSDDYYSDIDGDWGWFTDWYPPQNDIDDHYVDLILGRWPVDNSDDVDLLLSKLKLYEWPEVFPKVFARKILFIGGSAEDTDGHGAAYLDYLKSVLEETGISGPGGYLDVITELFYPQSGTVNEYPFNWALLPESYYFASQEALNRNNALSSINAGYNLIIHIDHSDTHKIGAAQLAGDYIYEFDFQSLSNTGEPSILWTAGCWPGHFEGADCFAEAGLLTSDETGLVAVIAFARNGSWGDWLIYYPFIDALYPFGWITDFINLQPVSYIGEAYRYSMNFEHDNWSQPGENIHKCKQNLFGDPTMYVWRDDPHQLAIEAYPSSIFAGISADITVSVTDTDDSNEPIAAIVCFYKDGDIFAIRYTDEIYGTVTLHDVEIAHRGQITVTAVKRREYMSTDPVVCNFIPAETSVHVLGSSGTLVNLEGFTIDDDNSGQSEGNGDGVANAGETIELDLDVRNLGISAATHLRAQLTVVSGAVQIDDDFEAIGYLAGGASLEVQNAFVVSIPDYLDENEPVQMQVGFIYDGGSWESPCDFTVLVDDIELPLHSIDVEYDKTGNVTTVEISNILAVNTGIGAAEGVEITLDNFNHNAVFSTDISMVGYISPGISAEAPSLFVECEDPPDEWKNPNENYFHECMFHIVVTDKWGREFRDTISVSDYNPILRPVEPYDLEVVEAGQDYLNAEWYSSSGLVGDFYLYFKEDGSSTWNRSNLLPIPVQQYTYSALESSTVYELAISAVDEYGQESPLSEMESPASTVCTIVDGWPIQLQGNTGSGPVSVNMDEDEDEEIVAVSSFGNVYIIDRDGSMETISPPVALDYDRYVSCAVGDVDNDSEEEIVVSYQVNINDGIAGLLIYDRDAFGNWDAVVVDDNISPGESVCAAMISGTPVLLQANSSPTLEIALRTKGDNSLYLWKLDNENGNWEMYEDFPIDLNCFFTPPVAVDYDEDGYDELLVTDLVNDKSQIHIVDFTGTGFTESYIDLSVYLGDSARVYSSLATVEWDGDYYLAGVAKRIDTGGSDIKKVFVCNLTGGPFPYMEWWHHEWQTGYDSYGNMGAPAIGQLDSDNEPEVAYTLEGMCGWNLLSSGNGYPDPVWTENAGEMAENPHGEWNESVKSATIIGGTTAQGSDTQVTFTGFSTLNYGHDPQDEMNVLPGFPAWSEDACFTAPLIVNLDNYGHMECLTTDASGLLTLYEWEGYSTSSGGWPMYQHDHWRTGFYNMQFSDGEKMDLNLVGVEDVNLESHRDAIASRILLAEVEVTGSGISTPVEAGIRAFSVSIDNTSQAVWIDNNPSAESVRTTEIEVQQIRQPSAVIIGKDYDYVKIALFSGNRELSSSEFPLYDGTHVIELAVPSGEGSHSDVLVARVDPDNEYPEAAEDNNVKVADNLAVSAPSITRVYLQSPCESIVLNIDILEAVSGGVSIRAYSIDGRLVAEEELIKLDSGSYAIELLNSDILPAGIYTVVIEGINEEELIRRVVVLP